MLTNRRVDLAELGLEGAAHGALGLAHFAERQVALLLAFLPFLGFASVPAPVLQPVEEKPESQRISLWVPGVVFKGAALFMQDEDPAVRQVVKRVRSARILVLEGARDKKFERKFRRLEKRGKKLEPMVTVKSEDANVLIRMATARNGRFIKKLQVIVQEENTLVYISLKGKFRIEELKALAATQDIL